MALTSSQSIRVHTLRQPFSDGLYAEAGAGRIPKTHDLTLRYVKEFGLTLTPSYPTSPTGLFFLRCKSPTSSTITSKSSPAQKKTQS